MSNRRPTPGSAIRRNAVLLAVTLVATFITVRLVLAFSPKADFMLGSYNVHHLITGLLLIALGGIPLAIFRGQTRRMDVAVVIFGIGLSLALDELVYLIVTDGSNASYLMPVSFWGGLIVVSLALLYTAALAIYRLRSVGTQHEDRTPSDAA